jgi:DNA invertase Pin-like site-specific DNA recombinase
MKVIAYVRVSTDTQAEKGLGLDMQRRAIRDWAKAGGHKIVAWYGSDEGRSGTNGLDTRPELAGAFQALHDGKADALAVYRLDRLARKLALQETWISQLERVGRQVISVTEPYAGDDEMRTLIRQVLGAVSEYERTVIYKRLQGGRAEKARQGGYAYGSPPYGWRSQDKALVPDEDEQHVLERMRELRRGGASYGAIAAQLNADGVSARRERARWHPQTVSRALERAVKEAAR